MIDKEAVELVGNGVRGGKRRAFSTASTPFRRRRIVHKSIASKVSVPVIKAFAEKLTRAAKAPKVVIVACMRKLLTIMNAMIKSNTSWSPKIA